ncbi:MAG: cysteine desulfurase family protein [Tissierellia bacterium]|nr:cysteine desulfurase family protein [Tissierellia bacterium]
MIYLDNCATTKPTKEVVDTMIKAMEEDYANPSSLHRGGMLVEEKIEDVRNLIGEYLNVSGKEIIFTSGGTESNNMILKGIMEFNDFEGNVVTSFLEHSSTLSVLDWGEKRGIEVRKVDSDSKGNLSLEEILSLIDKDTILLSLTHVNNELGSILSIDEIGKRIKGLYPNIHFHVDGVQGFGKIPIPPFTYIDSYSFSGHKIHGPKGIGGLYLSKNPLIPPLVLGGGQEDGLRSGTENVPGILGLGAAINRVFNCGNDDYNHVQGLREFVWNSLFEIFSDLSMNSPKDGSPYIINVSFPHCRGEVILHMLEDQGIYISTSSACHSNRKSEKNHVLQGIGLSEDYMEGTIRICFSKDNTMEELEVFIPALKKAVTEIQEIIRR